jgi:hypothetical protein
MTKILKKKAYELNKLFWEAAIDLEFYYFKDKEGIILCPEYMPDEERN